MECCSNFFHSNAKTKSICFIHQVMQKFDKFNAQCSCNLKRKLPRKNVHDEQKMMRIRSNIVNTNISTILSETLQYM